MTWSGPCPQCGHDRGRHHGAETTVEVTADTEHVLACEECSCRVTDGGRPWPAAAAE